MTERIDVLVVDDVAVIRSTVGGLLRLSPRVGAVTYAVDGDDAISSVATTPPDVVVMDIRMPKLDGIAAAREIRRRFPRVAIVLHSAYEDANLLAQSRDLGVEAYFVKGSPVRELVLCVVRAADTATARRGATPPTGEQLHPPGESCAV